MALPKEERRLISLMIFLLFLLLRMLARDTWFAWKNIKCEVDVKSEVQQYERYIVALTEMTRERVDVKMLSTRRYFCDIVVCSMVKENKILYRDYNHLNINGSFFVGRKILEDNAGIFN